MNYERVLPRDLFNEADLLKCYARLWIILDHRRDHHAVFSPESVPAFQIEQDESDGSLSVVNIEFTVTARPYALTRPLNSRQPWPLYATPADDPTGDAVPVFTADGNLTAEMRTLVGMGK